MQQLTPILNFLRQKDNFLVTGHFSPDGDAIGSTVALGFILQKLNKKFILYNESGLPERFNWLTLPSPLLTELPCEMPPNVITVDCGDAYRVGKTLASKLENCEVLNIDHHFGNPEFGNLNWVEPKSSSVGEMIAEIALALDIPLKNELGEAIYLAIVTDSGYFSYGNTSPRTMEIATEILRQGLQPDIVNSKIKNQLTKKRFDLHALALQNLRVYDDKIAVVSINRKIFKQTDTDGSDSEGLVSNILQIKGVQVALALREEPNGMIKFSLRSFGNTDIRLTACKFGGGGHKNAAGGILKMSLKQAEEKLIAHLQSTLFQEDRA